MVLQLLRTNIHIIIALNAIILGMDSNHALSDHIITIVHVKEGACVTVCSSVKYTAIGSIK